MSLIDKIRSVIILKKARGVLQDYYSQPRRVSYGGISFPNPARETVPHDVCEAAFITAIYS